MHILWNVCKSFLLVFFMNIEKIIDDVAKEYKKDSPKKTDPEKDQNSLALKNESFDCPKLGEKKEALPLNKLLRITPRDEGTKIEIYSRFKNDVELFIDDFLERCHDANKDKGMGKCYLETWQSCISEIGREYFGKNNYLRINLNAQAGERGNLSGYNFDNELLEIAVELYEDLCNEYRKQFFIYDCCKFAGMSKDVMYRLNELRGDILKKAHTAQEGSMRTALASGRSNVTAMAILLNHDYDYTRTTQIIHSTSNSNISAKDLPQLDQTQDIVTDTKTNTPQIKGDMM